MKSSCPNNHFVKQQILPCFLLFIFQLLSLSLTSASTDRQEHRTEQPQRPPPGHGHQRLDPNNNENDDTDYQLRGDPEDLTPLHPSHWIFTPPRQKFVQPTVEKEYKAYKPSKGENGDLAVASSRHKPQRQSYNRQYNPRPKHYKSENRHSDGNSGKGGYHKSDSYNGKKGYSTYASYDKANKDQYGDADHKQYRHSDGDKKSGGYSTKHGDSGGYSSNHGDSDGHSSSSSHGNAGHDFYGIDDGNSYTSAGEDYRK